RSILGSPAAISCSETRLSQTVPFCQRSHSLAPPKGYTSARETLLRASPWSATEFTLADSAWAYSPVHIADAHNTYSMGEISFGELSALGSPLDRNSFTGAQLAVIFDGPQHPDRVQGSFYNLSGVLESDFFLDFPFPAGGNRFCLENILGAMGVLQSFYSDAP